MSVGKSAEEVDAAQPSDDDVADALGFGPGTADDDLPSREELWSVVQQQQREISQLRERVDDLEDRADKAEESRADLHGITHDAKEDASEAREIAKSASAQANQLKAEVRDDGDDQDGAANALPGGVDPASSPLDFFSNCRQHKVQRYFTEKRNKKNSYRAIAAAKRWEEFATRRQNGAVVWTRDDLKDALTAILSERPHDTTVTRVWRKMRDLGGDDLEEKRRQISNKQEPKDVLKMDRDAAERLLDVRYLEFDLLETAEESGVTPVVTGEAGNGA
jgi:vacuolar-type H+-ATPase subunit I/STV1